MADADVGAGLAATAAGAADAAAVLARDGRRVRRLTWLTVGLWVLVVAVVVFLLVLYNNAMAPRMKWMKDNLGIQSDWRHPEAGTPQEKHLVVSLAFTQALSMGIAILTAAVGLLALAMLGTVLLVHASRRATLRQINASLQAISEQLRQMQAGNRPV